RIVVTHGGPSSFIMPLQVGKVPVVVPRVKELNEHVNDHQLDFAKAVAERQGNIIVVENIDELGDVIDNYDQKVSVLKNELSSNNDRFCSEFEKLIDNLVK
ncbi:MAG: multidrug MFS transporter, partial [Clostridiales bacterium]|nr:multidrug MFS transporter [Clostridiales bacterium]